MAAVVEGSVFRDGERVRITAQLIEAATDRHLWAKSYERDLRDILALHSEVARAIAREINIALTADEEIRLATARPVNPAAQESYLEGRYYLQQFAMGGGTTEQVKKSIVSFQRAIDLEPEWAEAYAKMAAACHFFASSGVSGDEYYSKSKAAAIKALELDETVSQAHSSLAFVLHRYEWDWAGAEREYRRAIALDPNSHAWGVALFFMSAGYYDEAIAWYQRAEERAPLFVSIKAQLGYAYTAAGQYDRAITQLKHTLELDPNNGWAYYSLAYAYLRKGMFAEAVTASHKAVEVGEGEREFLALLGYAYALAGKKEDAMKVLEEYKATNGDFYVNELAALYLALGKKDAALELLQKAFGGRSPELLYILHSPVSDSLRDDPSFQEILREINFPKKKNLL